MCQKENKGNTVDEHFLAAFIADFRKGKKTGDPMRYVRSTKKLIELYGSPKTVSEMLGVGKETVRILAKIAELPNEIQELVSAREIPLTIAFDLVPFNSERQVEIARVIRNLSFKEARKIIRYIGDNPEKSAEDARVEIMRTLESREINIAMIAIPKRFYDSLQKEETDVTALVARIIDEWLASQYSLDISELDNEGGMVSLTLKLSRNTFHALRRITRKPADLIEKIVVSWLRKREKTM